jgi:6-phosphogluconolactonase (cycloisomerase 2 family)
MPVISAFLRMGDFSTLRMREKTLEANREPGAGLCRLPLTGRMGRLRGLALGAVWGHFLLTSPSIGLDRVWLLRIMGRYDTVAQLARTREGALHLENTYDDATIAMFSPSSAGLLGEACDVAILERGQAVGWESESGLDAIFQASPHAHSVNFDPSNQFVLACDKGTDRIYVYRIEDKGCALTQVKVVETPTGTAPRHSAFHPRLPYVFVINELQPSLSSFSFDAKTGDLQAIQTVATVAKDAINRAGKRSMPADIHVHPNGRFVYGSTRGNDTIAIFRIDEATGKITAVDEVSTQGATPRGFNFDPSGRFLLVGNQDSNTVVSFAVDPESGRMSPTGATVDVPRPVCIRFSVL